MDNVIPFDADGPRVPIDLDRRRYLRLTNRALAAAELELSALWGREVNILTVLANRDGLSLNAIAIILWCGLRRDDPGLTLEQTFALIDLLHLDVCTKAIYDTWNLQTASAEPQEATEETSPLERVSPGDISGPLPGSNSALVTMNSGI